MLLHFWKFLLLKTKVVQGAACGKVTENDKEVCRPHIKRECVIIMVTNGLQILLVRHCQAKASISLFYWLWNRNLIIITVSYSWLRKYCNWRKTEGVPRISERWLGPYKFLHHFIWSPKCDIDIIFNKIAWFIFEY